MVPVPPYKGQMVPVPRQSSTGTTHHCGSGEWYRYRFALVPIPFVLCKVVSVPPLFWYQYHFAKLPKNGKFFHFDPNFSSLNLFNSSYIKTYHGIPLKPLQYHLTEDKWYRFQGKAVPVPLTRTTVVPVPTCRTGLVPVPTKVVLVPLLPATLILVFMHC